MAELHSHEVVLGSFRANAQGVVTGKVTIPRKTKPGYHTFELEGRESRLELFARIKVLGAKDEQGHSGPLRSGWPLGSNGSDRLDGQGGPGPHDSDGQGGPGPHDSDGQGNSHHPSALAVTGSEQALAVSGIAAWLVAAGGGTMLAVRRRRSS
ncbi:hypothetical protein [Streptomyces avermitilis]|uniref:hypothetical protein n=1 Tax=Streptomyces avermitilis TaxID=33903 RepID=UPI003694BC37